AGHLSNTPHQILVYGALGEGPPTFAHAPTVLGPEGGKLSKRSGARPLRELREEGLHPDAVVNYLSLLGWSSPTGDEVLARDRLVDEVTLDRLNAGDVVYDPTKLRWLSARHIDRMPLEELAAATRPYVEGSRVEPLLGDGYLQALDAVRSRLSAFAEVTAHLPPFLGPDPDQPPQPPTSDEADVLSVVRNALADLEAWDPESIQTALRSAGKAAGVGGRILYVPVRQALTGAEHGPPLGAVIAVQGRARALELLDRGLDRAENRV
ncbi:MAG: glutamate--tRNA ligase family protein, partial [Longimicrobiales bacterium]